MKRGYKKTPGGISCLKHASHSHIVWIDFWVRDNGSNNYVNRVAETYIFPPLLMNNRKVSLVVWLMFTMDQTRRMLTICVIFSQNPAA